MSMPRVRRPRVRLFHWRAEEAGPVIAKLRAAGYEAIHNPEPRSLSAREITESGVVAVVIDLSRLPSQGRYVAAWLRRSKITRHLPLVFARGMGSVTLWFVHDAGEYAAVLPSRRALAARSRLWILWQKGRRDGLNATFVRKAALALGLVDYKICSLDAVWSGMAFAVKKR